MTGSSFKYLMKEGGRSMWANRTMSSASILVQTACLLLIGAAILFIANVNQILDGLEKQNDISIYLTDGIGSIERDNIISDLERMDGIEEIVFVPRDEGLERFQEDMNDDAGVFEDLMEDNPLPDLIKVRINDVEQLPVITEAMRGSMGVEYVRAATDVAETLLRIRNMVTLAGTVIVAVLVVVSFVLTANTIKLTVFNRRKEINIMKYVGATDTFIRLPFVVEGIYLGLFAAVISFFVTWAYYAYLYESTSELFGGILGTLMTTLIPFQNLAWYLLPGFCIGGFLTGALGSMLFVRRHLKV